MRPHDRPLPDLVDVSHEHILELPHHGFFLEQAGLVAIHYTWQTLPFHGQPNEFSKYVLLSLSHDRAMD